MKALIQRAYDAKCGLCRCSGRVTSGRLPWCLADRVKIQAVSALLSNTRVRSKALFCNARGALASATCFQGL
jgi:hypothetical protein